MLKIKQMKKDGRRLYIYFKIPYFLGYKRAINKILNKYYDKESSMMPSLDITGKYIVMGYFLRSEEDISPYVKDKRNKLYDSRNSKRKNRIMKNAINELTKSVNYLLEKSKDNE